MGNTLKYILSIAGIVSILVFGLSAAIAISGTETVMRPHFTEPANMLLLGLGLIGFGSFIKHRLYR